MTDENLDSIVRNVIKEYTQGKERTQVQQFKKVEVGSGTEGLLKSENASQKELGVFNFMEDAIAAAKLAQKELRSIGTKNRAKFVSEMRTVTLSHKEELARQMVLETGLGNYEDKLQKIELIATQTPGLEDLKVEAYSGEDGLTTVEYSPYGVIGAVTPVTNPVETIVNNSLGMIVSGNSVVFNVHPSSVKVSQTIVKLLNQSIVAVGGPANLITMVAQPTMDTLDILTKSSDIRLLVGTGGPGLVKKLLQSGKKAIGAGAGNPPVLVDETAELATAAKEIIKGASFDNNILCIAEKEVFVVEEVADELVYQLLNQGAVLLNEAQVGQLMSFTLVKEESQGAKGCSVAKATEFHMNKKWIGKDVELFLKELGIQETGSPKLIMFECEFDHPFVQLEQMMPVLPIVRVKDVTEGIDLAVKAEKGNRHTAVMHSQNINNLTRFAREVESTIFVKNASSLAGVGFEGEGYATMSIAGPTGEGLTSAKSFSRKRRCVLGQGGLSI